MSAFCYPVHSIVCTAWLCVWSWQFVCIDEVEITDSGAELLENFMLSVLLVLCTFKNKTTLVATSGNSFGHTVESR